ncbi:sensor histidine kinase [Pseudorhodoplanes sinuspersici]|uniref:histidine kinase n=1 Tax=Pseudorhodoplanes sinuspersici TaxID=1235591 RepID=A0A1W6ZSB4_9HYPH|nr:ATP-binding protein [Pseudorhodoplanes sinuspersici]ARQ00309.1 PAS domain-containing sensor histidine kinase [Pseudorhodoplanes sinuspersici]RKE67534.1 PAS domain S-box-containing protein [Pseudorhodoplanes sinuspersici]
MANSFSVPAKASPILGIATLLFAVAIFIVDTFTPFDMAIAVLYVVVVLMAANLFDRTGLLLVAFACMALTITSYFLSHSLHVDTALVRFLVSLTAIIITSILVLANQTATKTLREKAELLDLTHDSVLVRHMSDDIITYWNRGAEELYGWPSEEAIGKPSHELLRTVFPEPIETINAEIVRSGRWEGDLVHRKRDGSQVTVSSRWSLLRNERGQPMSVLETNTDITERMQAEEAMNQVQAQLAHVTRVATLGELTASIAHEVNQPLAAVVTNGEASLRWINRDVPDMEEARSAIARMISEAKRASEVIAKTRAMSRKTKPEKVGVDIKDLVDEIALLIQRELINHRVLLRLDIPQSVPAVAGDRIQLQQVIMNLLMNGVQAMTTVTGRERELVVGAHNHEADQVLVSVRDTGVGFTPDDETRLFQAFYTTKNEGMGMGLSISRTIIEAHGGRIWASRNPDAGVTFQFMLPAMPSSEVAAPAAKAG